MSGGSAHQIETLHACPDGGADILGRALCAPVLDLLVQNALDCLHVVLRHELPPEPMRSCLLEQHQTDPAKDQRDDQECDRHAFVHDSLSDIAAVASSSMMATGASRSVQSSNAAAPW